MMKSFIASIYWNPPKDIFVIPYFEHPLRFYGVFFVIGFLVSSFLLLPIVTRLLLSRKWTTSLQKAREASYKILDSLTWYIVLGTLIGARLGHVLFYEPSRYLAHPIEILKVWEGGLASHGGVIGIFLALFLFARSRKKAGIPFSFIDYLDIIAIPTGFAGGCIRLGNFFNQEIIGTPSSLPWAVVFGNPAEGGFYSAVPVPRHPVQLYEAIAYFSIFIFLYFMARKRPEWIGTGRMSGLLLLLAFSARFILEFFKTPQGFIFSFASLQTGQVLSLPCMLLGTGLIAWSFYRPKQAASSNI